MQYQFASLERQHLSLIRRTDLAHNPVVCRDLHQNMGRLLALSVLAVEWESGKEQTALRARVQERQRRVLRVETWYMMQAQLREITAALNDWFPALERLLEQSVSAAGERLAQEAEPWPSEQLGWEALTDEPPATWYAARLDAHFSRIQAAFREGYSPDRLAEIRPHFYAVEMLGRLLREQMKARKSWRKWTNQLRKVEGLLHTWESRQRTYASLLELVGLEDGKFLANAHYKQVFHLLDKQLRAQIEECKPALRKLHQRIPKEVQDLIASAGN